VSISLLLQSSSFPMHSLSLSSSLIPVTKPFLNFFFGTEGVFLYELECVSGDEPADLTDLLVDWESNSTERVWFRSLLT